MTIEQIVREMDNRKEAHKKELEFFRDELLKHAEGKSYLDMWKIIEKLSHTQEEKNKYGQLAREKYLRRT